MLLDMRVKESLRLQILMTDVAFNESCDCNRLFLFNLLDCFFWHHHFKLLQSLNILTDPRLFQFNVFLILIRWTKSFQTLFALSGFSCPQIIILMNDNNVKEEKESQWHPNRAFLQLAQGITIDSCFPCGNIGNANIVSNNPLTIEIEGNTDISLDTNAKYWLYFRIRGFRRQRPIKFILKNANHLKKYYAQSRIKPFMVYKEEDDNWKTVQSPIQISVADSAFRQSRMDSIKESKQKKCNKSTNDLYVVQDEKVSCSTTTLEEKKKRGYYFAIFYPYSCDDLASFLANTRLKYEIQLIQENREQKPYYNEEVICYSPERRKISLVTITSDSNIESFSERQPLISNQLFPSPKDRPFRLKNCPVIIVTARVHPSETSSSFFVEGLIQFLLKNTKQASILRQLFIFQILPMLNPDGVQHGNFRFDNEMRNLNRFYGQSSIEKTPSIRAAELLISYFRNKNQQCQFTEFYEETYDRLFMYIDVHGHQSAIPSFIYGNHTDISTHLFENKLFCRFFEANAGYHNFSRLQCQFSKKNMTAQQKYDEYSKLCSGRVFAGRSNMSPQNDVFHSYTLEILPYSEQVGKRSRIQSKIGQKIQKMTNPEYSRFMAKSLLTTILDILDINPESKLNEIETSKIKKAAIKEATNELTRKLLFKRSQMSLDRICNNSDLSKTKPQLQEGVDNSTNFVDYIARWFNNPIYSKSLLAKTNLVKQVKLNKFLTKISKITQIALPSSHRQSSKKQADQSKKNDFGRRSIDKKELVTLQIMQTHEKYKSNRGKQEEKINQQNIKIIFATRNKEKKVESKISKQTLELKDDLFINLPRHRTIEKEEKAIEKKKNDSFIKDIILEETYKQEKQINQKMRQEVEHLKIQRKPILEIKSREIQRKEHTAIFRIHTEANNDIPTRINFKQMEGKRMITAHHTNPLISEAYDKKGEIDKKNQRKSIIEQFISKIKFEIEESNTIKSNVFQDFRNKISNIKPLLKDNFEITQKTLLPILRRNKIFTIVNERQSPNQIGKYRKRAMTIEEERQAEDMIIKPKKLLKNGKKDEIIKRSNKFLDIK